MPWHDFIPLFGKKKGQGDPFASASQTFNGLTDPALLEFIRSGRSYAGALETSAVFRCVDLISGSIGFLPLRTKRRRNGDVEEALDHPLHALLLNQPNDWQSAFEFKRLMETRVFVHGNAYARIIRSNGRVIALIPLDSEVVEPILSEAWQFSYKVGGKSVAKEDIFHLRGPSHDGISGLSRIKLAADAVSLSKDAERSLSRIYRKGVSAGGALESPHNLTAEARANLKASMETYAGAENAGKWMVLEGGLKANPLSMKATDAQTLETRRHQIEDIARFFGVPRPLMGMEDTSWGSGIEQLAILFVRFALNPSFAMWEQAAFRSLLTARDKADGIYVDFDERELLRGSMKDQGEFFAKALGSGGHAPFMTPNEVRDDVGLGRHPDGDGLSNPMTSKGQNNVASQAA